MIYNISGSKLNAVFNTNGGSINEAYSIDGSVIFPDLPIPTGDLNADSQIALPDIYNNGHGWTCTGLAYDPQTNTFLVGDIGKELPSSVGFASQIVRVSYDFSSVVGEIPLSATFTSMQDVQGITIDTSDGTIWLCSPSENKIHHINSNGQNLGSISITKPTGIAYSFKDDSLWVLNYNNKILHITKSGTTYETYDFAYSDTLDQCFLDAEKGYLYITAGANYTGRNNVYLFDINTHHQSITCTVDSYSVEGIWIGADRMVIVNDGYYHSATVQVNQANIYQLD